MTDITAKTLRIADAAVLRRLGVFRGSLKKVESSIRRLLTISEQDCLIITRQSADGEEETGFIALVPDAFQAETGRLSVQASSESLLPTLLKMAAHTGFCEHGFLRIEALVPADQIRMREIYEGFGFRPDCQLPGSAFRTSDNADRVQMSLLKTHSRYPAVGLVPYRLGLISVTGSDDRIESIAFHMAGEPVEQAYMKDLFHIWRLLDPDGRLILPADRVVAATSIELPAMVRQAVDELNAYFAGKRTNFELALDLSCGSGFQQKVWAELQRIPFGTTITYLDVAMQLTGGDSKKARGLTRAVGSACGANPVPVLIPCHRVIGHDGRLTGYSGGIQNKEFLLEHEMFGLR